MLGTCCGRGVGPGHLQSVRFDCGYAHATFANWEVILAGVDVFHACVRRPAGVGWAGVCVTLCPQAVEGISHGPDGMTRSSAHQASPGPTGATGSGGGGAPRSQACARCDKRKLEGAGGGGNCTRCKRVWYCSQACQAADWTAGHKAVCEKR